MVAPVATCRIVGAFLCALVWARVPVRKASLFPSEETTMKDQHTSGHQVLVATERFVGHAVAVVVGIILMFAGLSMGVTMVLLPVGIPVGLAGVLLFLWGLFSAAPRVQA